MSASASVGAQIVAHIGGLFGCEPGIAGEQPARHDMVGRLVDRFNADQHDPAVESLLAQRRGCLKAGLSGAEDGCDRTRHQT